MVRPHLKDFLAHFDTKGHCKGSTSPFEDVECCEKGTWLMEMDTPKAIFIHQNLQMWYLQWDTSLWGY